MEANAVNPVYISLVKIIKIGMVFDALLFVAFDFHVHRKR
jgi:hypothetical protein